MLKQLERDDLSESANIHFHFALGKAFEDKNDYDKVAIFMMLAIGVKARQQVQHEALEMENRFTPHQVRFQRGTVQR